MIRRIAIRTVMGLGAVAVLLIVAGTALYGWSRSESGRSWLASRMAALASVAGEREVSIGRLAGDYYRTIRLEDISARDAAGVWLSIGSLEIDWRPWELLHGRIMLDRLDAAGANLVRMPVARDTRTGPPDQARTLRQLRRFRVDEFAIADLTLAPTVLGERAVLRVRAAAGVPRDGAVRTSLAIERVDGAGGKAILAVAIPATGRELEAELRIDEPAGGLVARLLDLRDLPAVHGRLAGTGTLSDWTGDASLAIDSVATASAKFTVRHGATTAFDVSGDLALETVRPADVVGSSGWSRFRSALGGSVALHASGNFDGRRGLVTAQRVELSGAFGAISGAGRYDIGKGAGTAEVALRDGGLSRLAPVLSVRIEGQADLTADIAVQDFGEKITADIHGGTRGLATGERLIDRLLTPTPRFRGGLSLASGEMSVSELTVTTDAASLRLDGTMGLDKPVLAADYRLTVPDGVSLPIADSVGIECRCLVEGKISGPIDNPRTTGAVTASAVTAAGERLREASLAYRLDNLGTGPGGVLEGRAESRLGRLIARTGLVAEDGRWRLADLHVEGGEAVLDGDLSFPADGRPFAGALRAKLRSLAPWLGMVGIAGSGSGGLRVTFRPDGERQGAELTAEFADAQIEAAGDRPAVEFGGLTTKTAIRDLVAWKGISAAVDARSVKIGSARLRRITADASGSPSRIAVSASAEGAWGEPVSLRTTFVFAAEADRKRIEITRLDARALGERLDLAKPLKVTWEKDGIAVDSLALSLGKARLSGGLTLARDTIEGALSVADFPLGLTDRLWGTGLTGMLDAKATLGGSRRAPRGGFSATVADLRLPGQPARLGLSLSVTGDWREGRLALDGRMSDASARPARFAAALPLRLDPGGWQFILPPDAPVSGELAWRGDVAALWQFVPLPEHQLSGPGRLDVRLSGTLARPNVRGSLAIPNGRYESLQFGAVLNPLDVRVDFDGAKAVLARFAAKDGNRGGITATGSIAFDAAAGHPFDLRATLAELAVLRRDDFSATASGSLRFEGTTRAASIEGALETDRAEIRVLERLPPDVVELDVVEVGATAGPESDRQRKRAPQFDPTLKLKVEMPRRVFVRGRGIDSEWKGTIVVGGSVHRPRLSGSLESVRGQISVVGKVFRLRRGAVRFPDGPAADPVIEVTAVHEGRRLTAEAYAEGPVKNPTVTLASTPPLPQDEIVSQILFDKGAAKLGRIEAAQLAIALAQLSGKGGGVGNAMEFARKTLGVDVLRLETTRTTGGDEAAAVRAGKYLTDDIYVGVKQGATAESRAVGVEVEVTPNIVVESEVRQSGESDTSVKFKLDY